MRSKWKLTKWKRWRGEGRTCQSTSEIDYTTNESTVRYTVKQSTSPLIEFYCLTDFTLHLMILIYWTFMNNVLKTIQRNKTSVRVYNSNDRQHNRISLQIIYRKISTVLRERGCHSSQLQLTEKNTFNLDRNNTNIHRVLTRENENQL